MECDSLKLLSDIVIYSKYSRYLKDKKRRETWNEIVDRTIKMHCDKYPHLNERINQIFNDYVKTFKVLPSMRCLQFAGKAVERDNCCMYNCCYIPIKDILSFKEIMYLSLRGCGVGYSVQKHHIDQLPNINISKEYSLYVIEDSVEGWTNSTYQLICSFFGLCNIPSFDYSKIRPSGSPLETTGGTAPGPRPLIRCHCKIHELFGIIIKKKQEKLKSIDCHDIICHMCDAVLSGGIRRSALICGFSSDDEEMLSCKDQNNISENYQRFRANNSAIFLRSETSDEELTNFIHNCSTKGTGEPGIYLTNDRECFTNPCSEISLSPYQFCNLTEINASNIESDIDFYDRCRVAAFIGTLQASYTYFPFLRKEWSIITRRDNLLGVSMTGICTGLLEKYNIDLEKAANYVNASNKHASSLFRINPSIRTTCIKPCGTTSCVLGTSAGIHPWHSQYYIRNIRLNENEPLCKYLMNYFPSLMVKDQGSQNSYVFSIPIKAPEGSIFRNESAIEMLNRVKHFSEKWIRTGHMSGSNTHNVSCTISVKNEEWPLVIEWMVKNKDYYNGIALFPYNNTIYPQAPFEDIDENKYNEMVKLVRSIKIEEIEEDQDNTEGKHAMACAGGHCIL